MTKVFKKAAAATLFAWMSLMVSAGAAMAETLPKNWQLGFQEPVTVVMHAIDSLHNKLLILCFAIVIFVMFLLAYVVLKFRKSVNPVPSKTTHNTFIEIVWTLVPVLILVFIAIPSFKLLYLEDRAPPADLVIKATGHQWYWSYEYNDDSGIAFDSIMLNKDEAKAQNDHYLFATDTRIVVPVNKVVRVLVTASDVLHAWAMPAFGIKIDAVPGRLNETWFRAEKEGVYYGQCSELCGIRHAFMPIVVEVVSEEKYAAWLEKAKEQFASDRTAAKSQVAALSAE